MRRDADLVDALGRKAVDDRLQDRRQRRHVVGSGARTLRRGGARRGNLRQDGGGGADDADLLATTFYDRRGRDLLDGLDRRQLVRGDGAVVVGIVVAGGSVQKDRESPRLNSRHSYAYRMASSG